MEEEKFLSKATKRDDLIGSILSKMEGLVKSAQSDLLRSVIEDVVDQMEVKDGQIVNNTKNKRILLNLDQVFVKFANTAGLEVVKAVIDSTQKIVNFNNDYFKLFTGPVKLAPLNDKVVSNVNAWLGITEEKGIAKNGYLDVLLKNDAIKNDVRSQLAQAVISQQGHSAAKAGIQEYIAGKPGQTGKFEQYARNTVYDTFSQVDRAAAQVFADGLSLNYAIYEGGIIKTTRKFCREHNGKVFSREEIAAFNPKTAIPPGYNPFIDLGGYACRHHLNWIPDSVAFALRPDLKEEKPKEEAPAPTPKKVKEPEKPKEEKPVADTRTIADKNADVKTLPAFRNSKYINPDFLEKVKSFEGNMAREQDLKKQHLDLILDNNAKVSAIMRMNEGAAKDAGRKEVAAIREKIAEVAKELAKAKSENEKIGEASREDFVKNLTPGSVAINNKASNDKPLTKKIDKAIDFFQKVSAGYSDTTKLNINKVRGRAHYGNGEINVASKDDIKTIVHELAHSLEEHSSVYKAAVDFLNERTDGKPLRSLSSINRAYSRSEVYKEGGFYNPYVGKIYLGNSLRNYGGVRYTEIISMGLESFYKNPLEFYKRDPQHFSLIYNLFIKR